MEDPSGVLLTDDQYFLLYFIMGTYFGPDLKEGGPHMSALQRRAEGMPQYTANDLTGSKIRTTVLESVYYYVLRNAEQEVVVKQPLLLQYIHGSLPLSVSHSSNYLQFDDLFPPYLHFHFLFGSREDVIDSIVLLDNPATDCIKLGDIERFKRLTGLENFTLERESAIQYACMSNGALHEYKVQENSRLGEPKWRTNSASCRETRPDGNGLPNCTMPCTSSPCNAEPVSCSYTTESQRNTSLRDKSDSGMLFLPACPSKEEWSNLVGTIKGGFALTGSAARAQVGPILGLMDVGESEDSYIFRVALPGVRRDERDFSCEVENDGAVLITGVTETGERTVWKYSQAFKMQSQNLCPPGHFSISFMLPGPVDAQQFHGTFASDGILEGIALKAR